MGSEYDTQIIQLDQVIFMRVYKKNVKFIYSIPAPLGYMETI